MPRWPSPASAPTCASGTFTKTGGGQYTPDGPFNYENVLAWVIDEPGTPSASTGGGGVERPYMDLADGTWTITFGGTQPSGTSDFQVLIVDEDDNLVSQVSAESYNPLDPLTEAWVPGYRVYFTIAIVSDWATMDPSSMTWEICP